MNKYEYTLNRSAFSILMPGVLFLITREAGIVRGRRSKAAAALRVSGRQPATMSKDSAVRPARSSCSALRIASQGVKQADPI